METCYQCGLDIIDPQKLEGDYLWYGNQMTGEKEILLYKRCLSCPKPVCQICKVDLGRAERRTKIQGLDPDNTLLMLFCVKCDQARPSNLMTH